MSNLDLARRVYELLVYQHKDGLSRASLALKLGCDDRTARDAVNACRYLAATKPTSDGRVYVLGFDPEVGRYVAATDPHAARRVIAYQESRVFDINRALEAQKQAYERTFRQSYQANEQGRLL